MNKTNRFQTTFVIISIFSIIGLVELILIYLKFGEILLQQRTNIASFIIKTYVMYACAGIFCFLFCKYSLVAFKRISFFKKSEGTDSFLAITFSLIFALFIFIYIFNNLAEHPFNKKGMFYLLLIILFWIFMCFIFQYLLVRIFRVDSIRNYFLMLGSASVQIAIIAIYFIFGLVMAMNIEADAVSSKSKKPNVLLISIDTLRQDRLSCYGYTKNKTKNIDQLASDGVLFENTFSTDYWTLPAHASIFTSLSPEVHGTYRLKKISSALTTFPEILSKQGYNNIGIVDTDPMGYVGAKRGFDQGFKYYSHYPKVMNPSEYLLLTKLIKIFLVPFQVEHSSYMISSIIKWLDGKNKSPFFFFLHLFDVHHDENLISRILGYPYFPFEPYATELLGDRSKWESLLPKFKGGSIYLNEINNQHWKNKNYNGPPADQLNFFSALYDSGISHVDEQLGRLFSDMKKKGLYDSSIIILTSDHGEEFYEHEQMQHVQPYDVCLRIPLIIKLANTDIRGRRINTQTSVMDIAPTILNLIGLPNLSIAEGKSLDKMLFSERYEMKSDSNNGSRILVSGSFELADLQSVRSGEYKLIRKIKPYISVDKNHIFDEKYIKKELYNIKTDREEMNNLSKTEIDIMKKMNNIRDEYIAQSIQLRKDAFGKNKSEPLKLNNRTIEKLKTLGYIQ